jgi:DNA polymerase V
VVSRQIPKHAHGTANLDSYSSSTKKITRATDELFDKIVNKNLLVRRVTISANRVIDEKDVPQKDIYEQMDLFTDYNALEEKNEQARLEREKERKIQEAMIAIKNQKGKNAIVKGMNLESGATTMDRNKQIGGHKA